MTNIASFSSWLSTGFMLTFCRAVTWGRISVPAMLTDSYPAADICKVYSEYGWISFSGSRLYSSGGAARSIISVCPELSVVSCSKGVSGIPV